MFSFEESFQFQTFPSKKTKLEKVAARTLVDTGVGMFWGRIACLRQYVSSRTVDPSHPDRDSRFVSIMSERNMLLKGSGWTTEGKQARRPRATWFVVGYTGYYRRDEDLRSISLAIACRSVARSIFRLAGRSVTQCVRSNWLTLSSFFSPRRRATSLSFNMNVKGDYIVDFSKKE